MIKAQEKIQQQSSKNVHYNSYQLSTRDFLRGARFTVPSARPLHSKCDNALEKITSMIETALLNHHHAIS